MLYVVIPLAETSSAQEDVLRSRVQRIDPTAYIDYAPRAYFMKYNGSASSLAIALGMSNRSSDRPPKLGAVMRFTDYYGHADPALWTWIAGNKNDG